MQQAKPLRKYPFSTLGTTADVLSSIMTLVLGSPILIIIIFYMDGARRYFSIYDNFIDFLDGKTDRRLFLKQILIRKLIILLFGIPTFALLISIVVSEFRRDPSIICVLIGIAPFVLFYILCIKVKKYVQSDVQNINFTQDSKNRKELIINTIKPLMEKIKKIKFNSNEIIIISTILGTIVFGLLGWYYGTEEYNSVFRQHEFLFNYILAFIGFIVVSGLSYLLLTRFALSKNSDNKN